MKIFIKIFFNSFFIKISNSIVGRFSGGPAKVAVVASAMEGMVSGSSVAIMLPTSLIL